MFLPIRLQYLFTFSVMGSLLPVLSVYLEFERDMTMGQIGWVFFLQGLAFAFSPVIATYLADAHLDARRILAMLYITAAGMLLATWVAPTNGWVFLTMGVYAIAWVPIMSLQDSILFGLTRVAENQGQQPPAYHTVRIWGTIGFLVPSVVLFITLSDQPFWGVHFGLGWPVATCLGVASTFACLGALNTVLLTDPQLRPAKAMPAPTVRRAADSTLQNDTQGGRGSSARRLSLPTLAALKAMLRRDVLAFLAAMFLLHVSAAAYYGFYPNFLSSLGVHEKWLAPISSLGVVIELAYMAGFGWMKRQLGWKGLVTIGALCIALRAALLAGFDLPLVAVGVQLIHGMTVVTIHVAAPVFLEQLAAPGYRSSVQGLYQTIIIGGGRMLGAPLAGYIAGMGLAMGLGFTPVFAMASALGIAAAAIMLVGFPSRWHPATKSDNAAGAASRIDSHEEHH